MISDYQCEIKYHLGKANVVAGMLSHKTQKEDSLESTKSTPEMESLLHSMMSLLIKDLHHEATLTVVQEIVPVEWEEVVKLQDEDPKLSEIRQKIEKTEGLEGFTIRNDGLLYYQNRKVILTDPEIKEMILKEAHQTPYIAHLGSMKMC